MRWIAICVLFAAVAGIAVIAGPALSLAPYRPDAVDFELAAMRIAHERQMLDRMVRFCDTEGCRRRNLLLSTRARLCQMSRPIWPP